MYHRPAVHSRVVAVVNAGVGRRSVFDARGLAEVGSLHGTATGSKGRSVLPLASQPPGFPYEYGRRPYIFATVSSLTH